MTPILISIAIPNEYWPEKILAHSHDSPAVTVLRQSGARIQR